MVEKKKAKKTSGKAKVVTPKRRAKQLAHKSQPPPTFAPIDGEELSKCNIIDNHPVETKPNLNAVMYLLVDIPSHLSATEHFVDEVTADKAADCCTIMKI